MTYQNRKPAPKNPPISIVDAYWPVVGKLWANERQDGSVSLSATFARVYKDKDSGEYRETKNISGGDLLKLSRAAEKLYDIQLDKERAAYEQTQGSGSDDNLQHQDRM